MQLATGGIGDRISSRGRTILIASAQMRKKEVQWGESAHNYFEIHATFFCLVPRGGIEPPTP
jgi:hypothetical protein